jgi:hypothetical protein
VAEECVRETRDEIQDYIRDDDIDSQDTSETLETLTAFDIINTHTESILNTSLDLEDLEIREDDDSSTGGDVDDGGDDDQK